MQRLKVLFIGILAICTFSFTPSGITQTKEQAKTEKINWLSWEQAMELSRDEPRKILLNVYTDWCGWCKRMDQLTYNEPHIAGYINDNFYPVRFDAEQKGSLEYKGKTYGFVRNGKRGYHELAAELLKGRLSFPTVVFLDEDQHLIQSIVGYKSPEQFEKIATYFAKDHYKHTPWSTYQATYKPVLISE